MMKSLYHAGKGGGGGGETRNQPQQLQQPSQLFQSKLQFLDSDNTQLKHQVRDFDQSLKINKQIIDTLLQGNLPSTSQTVINKLREDNDHLMGALKKSYEERSKLNSRILLLEQINEQHQAKDSDTVQRQATQLQLLKQNIDRLQVIIDQKEKSFIDLYSLSLSRMPKTDKTFYTKLQEVIKSKQRVDLQALNAQPAQVCNLIKEKEKLQHDLERALTDIDQLKTLLAQNTIATLHTQEDENHHHQITQFYDNYKNTTTEYSPRREDGQSRNLGIAMSKSFTVGDPRSKSQNRRVPGLDFSNLKHVKEYKDWYAYAKKLEDALSLLRQRIKELEEENVELTEKTEKTVQKCEQLHTDYLNSQDALKRAKLELERLGATQKDESFTETFSGNKSRKSKRMMSMAQSFNKKGLTLQIEEIEKEAEEAEREAQIQAMLYKKPVKSDSQEDSPIREGGGGNVRYKI